MFKVSWSDFLKVGAVTSSRMTLGRTESWVTMLRFRLTVLVLCVLMLNVMVPQWLAWCEVLYIS